MRKEFLFLFLLFFCKITFAQKFKPYKLTDIEWICTSCPYTIENYNKIIGKDTLKLLATIDEIDLKDSTLKNIVFDHWRIRFASYVGNQKIKKMSLGCYYSDNGVVGDPWAHKWKVISKNPTLIKITYIGGPFESIPKDKQVATIYKMEIIDKKNRVLTKIK